MENDLVKVVLLQNKKNDILYGKLINQEKNNFILALGRIGRFNFNIHDKKTKVHWGNKISNESDIPTYDLKQLKHDVIIHLNKKKQNIDYKLVKRKNDLNLNDTIRVKLLNDKERLSLNDNIKNVLTIPNISTGLICKIININMWEPAFDFEHDKKILKIIPGSFSVGCGKYSKTTASDIETNPIYNRIDINKQSLDEIKQANTVFTIHFKDIDLVFDIKKI